MIIYPYLIETIMEEIHGVHLTTSNTVKLETEAADGPRHLVCSFLEVIKDNTREASDTNKFTVHRKCALLMEELLQRSHSRKGKPLTTAERIEMQSFMEEALEDQDENGVPYLEMVAHQKGNLVRKETLGLSPFSSCCEPVVSPELDHSTLTWKKAESLDRT